MSRSESGKAFREGFGAMAPVLPGVVPFGMTAGIAAVEAGFGPLGGVVMSLVIFAGASQIATAQLVGDGAGWVIVLLTAWVINVRFAMYSASLAPYLSGAPPAWRWVSAYLLTDQAYAISVNRFQQHPGRGARLWFYLGAALPTWVVWEISTAAGAFLGQGVPASWQLGFTVPLIFLAMLTISLRDRASLVAATISAVAAVSFHGAPLHSGLLIASVLGITSGVVMDAVSTRRGSADGH